MDFMIIGIAVFFNFAIIKIKIEKKRLEDAAFDAAFLALISFLFAGSFGGLVVATCSSMLMSIYLYFFPPKFLPKDMF